MEGQESYESDPSQGTVQKDLDLCTHPDVRDYRGNIRVCTRLSGKKPRISILQCFLGMIKVTSKDIKWSKGDNESAAGQGKAIQCLIHLVW